MNTFRIGSKVRVRADAKAHGRVDNDVRPGETGVVEDLKEATYGVAYTVKVAGANNHEWFKPEQLELLPKDLDNLSPGDLINTLSGTTKKVIDVLPNSVLLSEEYDHDETDAFWSIAEIRRKGWTLKQTEQEAEVTELSVAELEEKLGIDSGSLRVKKD